jgi:hypothetical protein
MPTGNRDDLIRELMRLFNMRNTQARGGAGPNWLSPRTLESEINRILTNISALPQNKQVAHARNIQKERANLLRYNAEFGPSQYRRQMIRNREKAFVENLKREVRRVANPPKRKRTKYLRRPAMSPDSNSSQNNLAAKQRRLATRVGRLATSIAQAAPNNKAALREQMRVVRRRLVKVKKTRRRLLTQRPPRAPSPAPSNSLGANESHFTPPAASGRASGLGRTTPRRGKSSESGGSVGAPRRRREIAYSNKNWSPGTQYSGGAKTPNRTRSTGSPPKKGGGRRTRSAP